MSRTEIVDAAQRLGIDGVTDATALRAGLGGNDLWRLSRDSGDLVLRLFPAGSPIRLAEREADAHHHAREHGVRTPQVMACARLGDRPALIMEWVAGTLVAESLATTAAPPAELGRRCGTALAGLHASAAPARSAVAGRDWVDRAGDRAAELRPRLAAHAADRLVHLDFHPENLIVAPDRTITVLDWANVHIGPPQADLARTLSILDMAREAYPDLAENAWAALDPFRDGFLAGYADAGGDPHVPAETRAWACAVQLNDPVAGLLPDWYLDRLRHRYRDLLASPPGAPRRRGR